MIKTDALIIGAGPTGLFTAHQLKIIGLDCQIVDNLDKAGGQCIELYPDKPIYDIPAIPECTGEELTQNLMKQLDPFNIKYHLNERVDEVKRKDDNWEVKTNKGTEFSKIKTTNVNILLNRVRLDQKRALKKRIVFSIILVGLVSLLAINFII